jgi:hypothetical protein
MKAYLITTGLVFGLITVLHVVHAYSEGWRRATDPFFMLTTALALGLCLWSVYLLRALPRA